TPAGDIVAFLRTADMDDMACIARSTDGGKTFKWQSMGFQGHPLNALQLPDKRVLLTYGYRHKPFGIRCRILNAECTDFATAEEFVIRDDGGNSDIGYSWSELLDNNRVLVTYYFNVNNGIRHIAGTIIEVN
ncbi:MAG: glycoside hydrolase, partial [Tannerella sp.]|nr:glycoside hydrolase [Tannerella sp.]